MDGKRIAQGYYRFDASSDGGNDFFHASLFMPEKGMEELWLRYDSDGFFRFSDDWKHQFLHLTSRNGEWGAACEKSAFFKDLPVEQSRRVPLADRQLLSISFEDNVYYLFVERVQREQMLYKSYLVAYDAKITIGSRSGSDILYDDPHIARAHAQLERFAGQWSVQCYDSRYGIYVNGKCAGRDKLPLHDGDNVCIMGLAITVGANVIAVRSNREIIAVDPRIAQRPLSSPGHSRYYDQSGPKKDEVFFNRLPRKKLELCERVISVEGPPMSMDQQQMPLILRMGSSMVMGGAAALAGNFVTLLSGVMFPFLSSRYTSEQRREYERLRVQKYREYLTEKRREIAAVCQEEQRLSNLKYPALSTVVAIAEEKTHLWERRPLDTDFLQLRLGTGTQRMTAKLEYPARRFALQTDQLEEEMYDLVERPHYVQDIPVVLALADTRACGVLGHRAGVIALIRQLVLQIAVLHSYDEVKIFFFLDRQELEQLEELRYLPHVWDDQRSVRLIATNEAEATQLGEYIQEHVVDDAEDLKVVLRQRPYYVIFALDKKLFESHETIKSILRSDKASGISIITAYDELPKESQKVLILNENGENICTTMTSEGGEDAPFHTEVCEQSSITDAMRVLANTRLKTDKQMLALPKMITFLEMLQAGRVEQLNPLKRWYENDPVRSLAAPVGIGMDGSPFMLDLHEKRQGPHGLVAGMTGSGKSEFILTYILSMALNYHPYEVAFVLIDYKGGGLAGAFENARSGVRLPHLVGTITNLDGRSIQRSLVSIESELLRRQRIFNETKSLVNEGTMDIYTYQKLYRAGRVKEPMPHLFIVSDEFAELKQQQPEFMSKLVSAARIGRSLGVHLILATQKPSGVVDDQIRSNTKFRVCLRVQERTDSMDMLKRPDAAELTDTGRFYLQVGYNEYFAMGQSAWCGAPYEPQDSVTVQVDDAVEVLDVTGRVIAKAKPERARISSGETQLVAVVRYLSELADSQGIHMEQLWQPELPEKLDIDALRAGEVSGPMSVSLGLVDDPEMQRQFPLVVDFETCGNMLTVGESGCGKTLLLQSILCTLSQKLSPRELHFYILDYSSRMMKLMKPLPQCGAVLQEEDADRLDEFFRLINSIVAERKRLFSQWEVDSFPAARRVRELPLILVVLDNYAGLLASKVGEQHGYKMQSYLKDSANYGVKYIISCSHLNELSNRIRQELEVRLPLHVRDKYDYSDILGCKVSYQPPDRGGRGLVNIQGRALEFQAAAFRPEAEEKERVQHIKDLVQCIQAQYGTQEEVQHLAVSSETASYADFAGQFKRRRIPLGYAKPDGKPVALPLKQFSALSVYFGDVRSVQPVLENFLYAAEREKMEIWVVQRGDNSIFDGAAPAWYPGGELCRFFSLDTGSQEQLRTALVECVEKRTHLMKEHCAEHGLVGSAEQRYRKSFDFLVENTTPLFLLIESFSEFCNVLDSISALIYGKCFELAQRSNIYVVACFEPDDFQNVKNKTLYSNFSYGANILLFGGQFDRQELCALSESASEKAMLPYNACLMNYQGRFYPLVMPCGELIKEEVDADEMSIF